MATKLSKADKAIRKLEKVVVRFSDINSIDWYLDGDHMTKTQLIKQLNDSRKKVVAELDNIDRVFQILKDCPERI